MKQRQTFLPFALPDIDGSELQEVKEALESGWITTGPKARQFEAEFAAVVGAKHAVAVNSCTAAMHLALEAIGLQSGDEVITTPYTFAATAEVIRYFDAKPVFVDIDPATFNINADLLEEAVTSSTKAILPVHIAGYPARMKRIGEIAAGRGIPVIEDAAHADPRTFSKWNGGESDSAAVCFSFYATKTITTGEGGMICTNDDALADRCRVMALHGISRDAWKRYTAEGNWYYEITSPGYKYNMTDVAAAMGLAQLRKSDSMLARRREIAEAYNRAFRANPKFQIPDSDPCHGWHLYMLRVNVAASSRPSAIGNFRAKFVEELKARNIGTSVHFIPLHLHPYYRETYGYTPEDYPVAYAEYLREISLPVYSKMSDRDVQDVVDAVLDVADRL
ncbi:MAG: DegT/DnrJ/EryC1/StrS family aminotransferase [Bacteroidetes bacterium]|nr:DegT/DnrJ/EryC1/StrS family aminotransferase [Bacteroidota bacterium]MCW5897361.1 DegT/DnrJ/EryC1/StrS family aminotransferase [Bacteroidota bacterium]